MAVKVFDNITRLSSLGKDIFSFDAQVWAEWIGCKGCAEIQQWCTRSILWCLKENHCTMPLKCGDAVCQCCGNKDYASDHVRTR
jgi:hypothetical protein